MAAKERRGELLQFTARMGGVLVGNLRVYLFDDIHTGTRGANEDTLYLSPAARIGFAASRFIDYAERCLASVNVDDVWIDTKILHDEKRQGDPQRRRADEAPGLRARGQQFHKRLNKE
jgi:hypothetical protein